MERHCLTRESGALSEILPTKTVTGGPNGFLTEDSFEGRDGGGRPGLNPAGGCCTFLTGAADTDATPVGTVIPTGAGRSPPPVIGTRPPEEDTSQT